MHRPMRVVAERTQHGDVEPRAHRQTLDTSQTQTLNDRHHQPPKADSEFTATRHAGTLYSEGLTKPGTPSRKWCVKRPARPVPIPALELPVTRPVAGAHGDSWATGRAPCAWVGRDAAARVGAQTQLERVCDPLCFGRRFGTRALARLLPSMLRLPPWAGAPLLAPGPSSLAAANRVGIGGCDRVVALPSAALSEVSASRPAGAGAVAASVLAAPMAVPGGARPSPREHTSATFLRAIGRHDLPIDLHEGERRQMSGRATAACYCVVGGTTHLGSQLAVVPLRVDKPLSRPLERCLCCPQPLTQTALHKRVRILGIIQLLVLVIPHVTLERPARGEALAAAGQCADV
eukprot:scaffold16995_cov127-Isochrysis_galbana.AAC.2